METKPDSKSSWVKDVTTAGFEGDVVARSKTVPVVVDFWAAWCGPCRVLGPVLEREIAALGGKLELAKVDTDANAELASRFAIQGIPAVKAFRDGAVVSEFVGAQPAAFVKQWLAALVPVPEVVALEAAEKRGAAGDRAAAEAALRGWLDDAAGKPDIERRYGARALAALGRLLLDARDVAAAEPIVARLDARGDAADVAAPLLERLRLARDAAAAGGVDAARAALARDPADREARWALAAALAAAGEHEPALAELLELAASARKPRGDDARRAMLAMFDSLGADHPLTREYRRRLQIVT
jgi:putative thioredoxin